MTKVMRSATALAEQAKVLSKAKVDALLDHAQRSRNTARNTLIVLLSIKAGMAGGVERE